MTSTSAGITRVGVFVLEFDLVVKIKDKASAPRGEEGPVSINPNAHRDLFSHCSLPSISDIASIAFLYFPQSYFLQNFSLGPILK